MGNVENLPLSGSQCFKIFDCGSYVAVTCILYFQYFVLSVCLDYPLYLPMAGNYSSSQHLFGQGRRSGAWDSPNIDACINVNININISLHVDFNQILTFVARESSHARHKYNEAKRIIIIIMLLQNLYIIYDHGTITFADIELQFKLLRICS